MESTYDYVSKTDSEIYRRLLFNESKTSFCCLYFYINFILSKKNFLKLKSLFSVLQLYNNILWNYESVLISSLTVGKTILSLNFFIISWFNNSMFIFGIELLFGNFLILIPIFFPLSFFEASYGFKTIFFKLFSMPSSFFLSS